MRWCVYKLTGTPGNLEEVIGMGCVNADDRQSAIDRILEKWGGRPLVRENLVYVVPYHHDVMELGHYKFEDWK